MIALPLALFAAYLLGSIPTGFLLGRLRGRDIRREGSGNIGATNVYRTLGPSFGVLVLLLDFAKGFGPPFFFPGAVERLGWELPVAPTWAAMGCGAAAIAGHTFPIFLGFKGGKGVATGAGVMGALAPGPLAIAAFTWAVLLALLRYVSLASLAAALTLPVADLVLHGGWRPEVGFELVLAGLVAFRHRGNLGRLVAGTEPRVGRRERREEVPHG